MLRCPIQRLGHCVSISGENKLLYHTDGLIKRVFQLSEVAHLAERQTQDPEGRVFDSRSPHILPESFF